VLPSIGEAAALVPGLTAAARLVVSDDLIPSVPGPMPRPALRKLPAATRAGAAAAYFPACVNRIFGSGPGRPRHPSLPQALVEVSARAGKPLWIPDDVAGKCCSTRGAARATSGDMSGWPLLPAMRCGSGAGTARCR
jgi:D-lactate dehydrogenase